MAEAPDQTAAEPWESYDATSAEDLIDGAGRRRSVEKLQAAVDYERAGKNRVTVIDAFEQRINDIGDTDNSDDAQGDAETTSGTVEVADGDVPPANKEADTSVGKNTGQKAADEDVARQGQRRETNAKAAKAQADGGVTPRPVGGTAPVYAEENRQDVIALAGHQYRDSDDVDPDPGYEFDEDQAKTADVVDHIAVAGSTEGLFLELDGEFFRLDVNLGLALNRLIQSASVALNN